MLFQNYRELVTEKTALEYFGIVPHQIDSKKKGKRSEKSSQKGTEKTPKKKSRSPKNLVTGSNTAGTKSVKKLAPAK